MNRMLLAMMLMLAACPALGARPDTGDLPPPALGKDRAGNEVDLGAHRGKVVIVTFWASWCGPCRKELPILGRFQKVVGRDALEVIAVNSREPRREYNSVVRANRDIDVTWVHDASGRISGQYGVESLPNMFILGHDGKVAFTHVGYSEESLPGIIKQILSLLPDEVKARPAADT